MAVSSSDGGIVMVGHEIIVVGASAGGVEASTKLVAVLPPDLPAVLFVVLHISRQGTSVLPSILTRAGSLKAIHPTDGTPIQYGQIYVAPPDRHVLLKRGYVHLAREPQENRHRQKVCWQTNLRHWKMRYGVRSGY